MSDITERLRRGLDGWDAELLREAADEIDRLRAALAELDIAKHGVPGPIAQQGLRYLSMKARAEQAEAERDQVRNSLREQLAGNEALNARISTIEAERDRANELLREVEPFIGWCGPSGDLKERIDAHLAGEQEG